MDPFTIAALGTTLVGAYGAYRQGKDNQKAQADANDRNAQEAQKQRDYQSEMSNTSKRREMADLKAAGLNPLLAAQGGASTPSGAMATASPETDSAPSSIANALSSGVNTGFAAQTLKKDLAQKDANLALTTAQQDVTKHQAQLTQQNANKAYWDNLATIEKSQEFMGKDKEVRDLARELKKTQMETMYQQDRVDRANAQSDLKFQSYDSINRRVQSGLGTASKAVDLVNPFNKWMKGPGTVTTEHYNSQGEHMGTRSTRKH